MTSGVYYVCLNYHFLDCDCAKSPIHDVPVLDAHTHVFVVNVRACMHMVFVCVFVKSTIGLCCVANNTQFFHYILY